MASLSVASLEEIKCEMESVKWWFNGRFKTLMKCRIRNQLINGPDFTVADFESQETVEAFDIRENSQVEFIPKNLAQKLPKLISIEISYCTVESVEDHHFQGLSELIELSLAHNKIKSISTDSFKTNIKLESLSLNGNEIIYLSNDHFQSLINLKRLNLNDNKIVFVQSKSFENLINLKILSISRNKLETFSANLSNCRKLQMILLDDNELKSIDENVLAQLKDLARPK
jgi:Leucine-rich repeat (LRR) protein